MADGLGRYKDRLNGDLADDIVGLYRVNLQTEYNREQQPERPWTSESMVVNFDSSNALIYVVCVELNRCMSVVCTSSRTSASRPVKDPNAGMKRFSVILLLILIGFITVIIIFTRLGKSVTDGDPFLDPMANPHIRVQEDSVNDA